MKSSHFPLPQSRAVNASSPLGDQEDTVSIVQATCNSECPFRVLHTLRPQSTLHFLQDYQRPILVGKQVFRTNGVIQLSRRNEIRPPVVVVRIGTVPFVFWVFSFRFRSYKYSVIVMQDYLVLPTSPPALAGNSKEMTGATPPSAHQGGMLALVHNQVSSELEQDANADTVMMITVATSNLVILAVNSAIAWDEGGSKAIPLVIFLCMTLGINGVAFSALHANRDARTKLLLELVDLYRHTGVHTYNDARVLENAAVRYTYFRTIIFFLVALAVVVPHAVIVSKFFISSSKISKLIEM